MEIRLELSQSYLKSTHSGKEALVVANVSVNSLVYKCFLDPLKFYYAIIRITSYFQSSN